MNISLVMTCLNEMGSIERMIESIDFQTKMPDEVVIVDGGSTDGTLELLEYKAAFRPYLRVVSDPTCNIKHCPSPVARGRNIAIGNSTGNRIIVTDAGCYLDRRFVENMTGAPIVGGRTEIVATNMIQEIVRVLWAQPKELDVSSFSSRALAFDRWVWEESGGYPEKVLTAEDTLFNLRLKKLCVQWKYRPDAVVFWSPPRTIKGVLRQSYRYSKGDALSGTNTKYHWKKLVELL